MIDIIIPIYNTPIKDIKRCLESIFNQTYKNYTIYIIDDGSNKETKDFLNTYKRKNIIIKSIKNNGVSNARNVGIEISHSKYITFVDSDDTLNKDFLKEAIEMLENYNLDLIIGGYNEINNNKITKTRTCLPGLHIYDKTNINPFLEKLISSKVNETNKEIDNCPTGRIYTRIFRKESINKIRFNTNIRISEDTLFMIDYTLQKPKIGIIDKIWYNYYINEYSVSNKKSKELLEHIEEFINEITFRYNNNIEKNIKEAYLARLNKAKEYKNKIEKSLKEKNL